MLGTFWPYSADPSASLAGVVAGRRTLSVRQTALTLVELLIANIGKRALISENSGARYEAVILSVPRRSKPQDDSEQLGGVILFRTEDGTRAVGLNLIRDVTFLEEPETSSTRSQFRNRLELDLDWKGQDPAAEARVGMVYLQKGIRWIPSYKVELSEDGTAQIRLQATLLNEITDLENVTVNLVIGVPSFDYRDHLDPIALQDAASQLSRHFPGDGRTAQAFSNALMTQVAGGAALRADGSGDENRDDQLAGSAKSEDLFVFTLENISLKKGERMVVPITEFELPYENVFTLDLPFAPPPEVQSSLNLQRQEALAQELSRPVVRHNIRLSNDSAYPLTTAPALVLRDGRLIAQGLMTYTAVGAICDLKAGDAVDVQVGHQDEETGRVPDAVVWQNKAYARVNLTGEIRLTNRRGTPVRLEVTRWVLGDVGSAGEGGGVTRSNPFEAGGLPSWWGWYNWPSWWRHLNGVSRIVWKLDLPDQESAALDYTWHYHWR